MTDTCEQIYADLPCGRSGVATLTKPIDESNTKLTLAEGHGDCLPDPSDHQHFYIRVIDPCNGCCEHMRVVKKANDELEVERDGSQCECISAPARVEYDSNSNRAVLDKASALSFNVVSPLEWDCETRTLSLNCEALMGQLLDILRDRGGDDEDAGDSNVDKINKLEGRLKDIEDELSGLPSKEDMEEIQEDLSDARSTLDNLGVDDLKSKLKNAAKKSEVNDMKGKLDVVEGDVSALKTFREEAENNINDLSSDMSTAKDDIETLQGDMDTAKDDIKSLQSDVGDNSEQVSKNKDDISDLKED